VYVLDAAGQPAPLGAEGEIYVGGPGLARGYEGQAGWTAARFVPDGVSGAAGSRLYRTGDRGRYRADGTLEFLGRRDTQVKIHGWRVELEEIEAMLASHPSVTASAVVPSADQSRLIGYVVAPQAPSLGELRRFLQQRLPDYMVPAQVLVLPQLPRTSTGKLDRAALPPPAAAAAPPPPVPPRTPVERALAAIWQDVLPGAPAGIHDNFFEAGGDSILSIQLIARASQAGIHLTPRQVFDSPTIAELGVLAVTTTPTEAEQGPVTGPTPLSPIQHWFFEQSRLAPHHYNQAVLLELPRRVEATVLTSALQSLLTHHDALRLRVERRGDGWTQWIAPPSDETPFTRIDLADVPPQRRQETLDRHVARLQASLNLTHGPLVRMAWFDHGGAQPDGLLLVIHHLAVDGVSWRILLEDLERACGQLDEGLPVVLPPKTCSFRSWSKRLQRYAESETLRAEADYWLTRSDAGGLPLVGPVGENTVGLARRIRVGLDAADSERLITAPRDFRATVQDMLLTALVAAFADTTDQRSLLVDIEGHGREDMFDGIDVSRTVGWFTARFPLCLTLPEDGGPASWLAAIKEQMRGVPNHGIGHGVLRYLHPDRAIRDALASQPRPDVSFTYMGQLVRGAQGASWRRAGKAIADRAPAAARAFVLDIGAVLEDGCLEVSWEYSPSGWPEPAVTALADTFVVRLKELLAISPAAAYSVADFPHAAVSQAELGKLLAMLEQVGAQSNEGD
jgi:non-ribosomal peptide synthase protein (TIGR01720 family)